MRTTIFATGAALAAVMFCFGCGSDAGEDTGPSSGSGTGMPTAGMGGGAGVGGDGAGPGGSPSAGGSAPTGSGGMGAGGGSAIEDPDVPGPYQTAVIDDVVTVPATGNSVAIHAVYPTAGPGSGPYPVVLMGHGFQLPPSQYYGYLDRLATHGFVALTVDFVAGFVGVDHPANAEELLYGIDWVAADPTLGPIADTDNVGASGHSLGGKIALLAATMDPRIKASITLDPVDGGMSCTAQTCPDVSALMPIPIPTGFLGETLDATGGFQACAPANQNFTTFYANTSAPSLSVEVLGANHMSFLDDVSTCGFTCGFCNSPTLDNATVNNLAKAFVVAFYARHLEGKAGYDTYLTGADAQMRYVDPGLVTIQSK